MPDDSPVQYDNSARSGFERMLRRHGPALLLVVTVALWARLTQLGSESLWIDEAITFGRIRLPLGELIADTIRRKHLPTYFLLLKAFSQLGDSEWMLRFPSALFGTLAAALTYGVATTVHSRRAGLLAGFLVGVASGQVHYGQEARMYALFEVATTLGLLGLVKLARDPQRAALPLRARPVAEGANQPRPHLGRDERVAYGYVLGGTVLALYTHNTAPFFVVALNAAAAVVWFSAKGSRAGFLRNWVICMVSAFLAWSPWLPVLRGQTEDVREHWVGRKATYEWTRDVVRDLYGFGDSTGAMTLLVLVLLALAAYGLRRRPRLFFAMLAFSLCGTIAAYGASQVVPMFYRRLLIWTGPPWFALLAVGVAALPASIYAAVSVALGSVLVPALLGYYARETKPAWRPMLERLVSETDEHSVILNARAERFLTYYFERNTDPLPRRPTIKVGDADVRTLVGDAREFYVVGQTQEAEYRRIRQQIGQDRRYKVAWTKRSQNAVVMKVRVKSQPAS